MFSLFGITLLCTFLLAAACVLTIQLGNLVSEKYNLEKDYHGHVIALGFVVAMSLFTNESEEAFRCGLGRRIYLVRILWTSGLMSFFYMLFKISHFNFVE